MIIRIKLKYRKRIKILFILKTLKILNKKMKKLIILCLQVKKHIIKVEVIPESFKIMSKNDFKN